VEVEQEVSLEVALEEAQVQELEVDRQELELEVDIQELELEEA
jgi:hypothetical protein